MTAAVAEAVRAIAVETVAEDATTMTTIVAAIEVPAIAVEAAAGDATTMMTDADLTRGIRTETRMAAL